MADARQSTRGEPERLSAFARSNAGLDALTESIEALPYEPKRLALTAFAVQVTVHLGGRYDIDAATPLPPLKVLAGST